MKPNQIPLEKRIKSFHGVTIKYGDNDTPSRIKQRFENNRLVEICPPQHKELQLLFSRDEADQVKALVWFTSNGDYFCTKYIESTNQVFTVSWSRELGNKLALFDMEYDLLEPKNYPYVKNILTKLDCEDEGIAFGSFLMLPRRCIEKYDLSSVVYVAASVRKAFDFADEPELCKGWNEKPLSIPLTSIQLFGRWKPFAGQTGTQHPLLVEGEITSPIFGSIVMSEPYLLLQTGQWDSILDVGKYNVLTSE